MVRIFTARSARTGVGVLAAAALLVSACGSDDSTDGPSSTADDTTDTTDGGFDPDEAVTLTFTWWGNDDRAERYGLLIDAFNETYPNITINGTFTDFPAYWEKRQTEAAGGGLPDVWQFSDSYLRQYGETDLLLDLGPYADEYIDFAAFDDALLQTGQLEGTQYSLPTGYSAWAVFLNDDLLSDVGIEPYEGGTDHATYVGWMESVTAAGGGSVYGGSDYAQRIQGLEIILREQGKNLYTDDGQLGFTEDELRDYWNSTADARDVVTVPQSQLEEIMPISGFGGNLTASEMSWSNFLGGYLADSGADSVTMAAPPTENPGSQDLYRQAGLQMAVSTSTSHPEAAALFLDFVVNSPEAGEIFGTTLGFPASSTKLAGATLEGPDAQVAEYLDSVADRIGEAPPVPVIGYGSLEQTFWDLGKSVGLGAISVDDAVQEFFSEAAIVLG